MNGANVQSNDWTSPPGSAPGAGMSGPPGVNPALPVAYADGGVIPDDGSDAASENDSDSDDAPKSPVDIVKQLLADNTAKTFPQGVIGDTPSTMTDEQKQFFTGAPSKLAAQYLKDHPGYDTSSDDQSQEDGVLPAYDAGGSVETDGGDAPDDETPEQPVDNNATMTPEQADKESKASTEGVAQAAQDDPEAGWGVYQHLKHLYNHLATMVGVADDNDNPDTAAHAATKAAAMVPNGETVHYTPSENGGYIASVMNTATGNDTQIPLTSEQMKALHDPTSPTGSFDSKTANGDSGALQAVQKTDADYVHNFSTDKPKTDWNAQSPKTFAPGPATANPPPIAMQAMKDTANARDNKLIAPNLTYGAAIQAFGKQAVNVAQALPPAQRMKYLQQQATPDTKALAGAAANKSKMELEQFKQQQVSSRATTQQQRIADGVIVNAYSRLNKDPTAPDAPPAVKAAMQRLSSGGGQPAATQNSPIRWTNPKDGKTYLIQQ